MAEVRPTTDAVVSRKTDLLRERIIPAGWLQVLCLLYGCFLVGYVGLRSWMLSFTHDEAYSFIRYVRADFWKVLTYQESDPNNHMLNSLLMKLESTLGGDHWFSLRFHSLVALVVFLFFLYKLLKSNLSSGLLLFCGLVLCTFNPFCLDFFSLARGYAGAFACMVLALYQTSKYIRSGYSSWKHIFLASLFAALSVLFHVSMLNFFLPFSVLLLALPWIAFWQNNNGIPAGKALKHILAPAILTLATLVFILPVVFRFKAGGEFDFAGLQNSFWQNTVGTLLNSSFYFYPYSPTVALVIEVILCGILAGAVTIFLLKTIQKRRVEINLFSFVLILVLGILVFIFAQHFILGNPYPTERFVNFLHPLYMLLAVLFFDQLNRYSRAFLLIPVLFTLAAGLHLYRSLNLSRTQDWFFDGDTRSALLDIQQMIREDKNLKRPVEIGVNWLFEPSMNYHRDYLDIQEVRNVNREKYNRRQKYYYTFLEDTAMMRGWPIRLIKRYPLTGSLLLENLAPERSAAIYSDSVIAKNIAQNLFMELNAQKLKTQDSILVEIVLRMAVKRPRNEAAVYLSEEENGQTTYYQEDRPDRYAIHPGQAETYYFSYQLPPLKDSVLIKVYTMGADNSNYRLYGMKVNIYSLK